MRRSKNNLFTLYCYKLNDVNYDLIIYRTSGRITYKKYNRIRYIVARLAAMEITFFPDGWGECRKLKKKKPFFISNIFMLYCVPTSGVQYKKTNTPLTVIFIIKILILVQNVSND